MKSYKNFKTETVGIPEFDKIRKDGRLLIEYIRGSVSYGLDTPESDKDSGAVYICSIKELLGYNTYKEEIADFFLRMQTYLLWKDRIVSDWGRAPIN